MQRTLTTIDDIYSMAKDYETNIAKLQFNTKFQKKK